MNLTHQPDRHRFVLSLPGGDAFVEYAEAGPRTLDLQHTVVPEAEQGQGVGSALVERVLAFARENGLKVIPSCPFVRSWLEEHAGWEDVVV
jgi:hypothetical protein